MITLNLLPPDARQRLRHEAEFRRWRGAMILVLAVTVTINLAVGAGHWWLDQRHHDLSAEINRLTSTQQNSSLGQINQKITALNDTVSPLRTSLAASRPWSTDLVAFLNTLPANIILSELTLTDQNKLTLVGLAPTRADFIQLDESLKNHALLKNVTTTSQANKRVDLPFAYQATYAPTSP